MNHNDIYEVDEVLINGEWFKVYSHEERIVEVRHSNGDVVNEYVLRDMIDDIVELTGLND